MNAEEYLESIMPSRDEVDRFLTRAKPSRPQPNRGWIHDPELGWVHDDSVHDSDGVGGTRTFYSYEEDGARRVLNAHDQSSRIHTYGDSFTHCDQVSDGETWQEYLAAHLGEPVRNYGVGGYGVYQAYRRMRKIEREGNHIAEYIILNIYDDDHFRSLDSWRRLRFGRGSVCGYTLPHLRVNVEKDEYIERENLLQNPEDVYKLCDRDWVIEHFQDDPVLKTALALKVDEGASPEDLQPVAVSFGLPSNLVTADEAGAAIQKLHTEAALFSTRCVVEMTERFCEETGKKLMVVLSFGQGNILRALNSEPLFDQTLVDWLVTRSYPVFDMREAFVEDFKSSSVDPKSYLARYYNGHHSPAGNFFTAWALKDTIVEWLNPKPRPYSQ